ncbi:MAG: flavoprotein, partial [bacterium]
MSTLSAELPLVNRRILLAVTGSVAACKCDRIIRELEDMGATVQVLLTDNGARFFSPETAGALTSEPVLQNQFDSTEPGEMAHITAKQRTDCILVAPATANRLLQIPSPQASDTLGTVLQAFSGPVLYAPAMNPDMWDDPTVQSICSEHSSEIVTPEAGTMACGETGPGRLPDPAQIVEFVVDYLWPEPLKGKSVAVSSGPTREPWDQVRFLSNRSSGKMGEAVAKMGA